MAGVLLVLVVIAGIIGSVVGSDEKSTGESAATTRTQPSATRQPTLTTDQAQYVASVATADAERYERERVAAQQTSAARPTNTPVPPPYQVAIISAACNRGSFGYITCEGFVKNLSGRNLENIVAVVRSYVDGTPVSSDDALIDYNPLLPSQESPWSVLVRDNPAFNGWIIEIKELLGGTILTRYDYRTPTP